MVQKVEIGTYKVKKENPENPSNAFLLYRKENNI